MGNVPTSHFEQKDEDRFWINDVRSLNEPEHKSEAKTETSAGQKRSLVSKKFDLNETVPKPLSEANTQKLNEFKLELARKHEKRRIIIEVKHKEMEELREEIIKLKLQNDQLKSSITKGRPEKDQNEETERLRKENEDLRALINEKSSIIEESEIVVRKNRELRISIADMQKDLQRLNSEIANFEEEREDYRRHVVALKDVISVSKNMLQIRESQLKELKEKVGTIEKSLVDREMTVMSDNLKQEYERQIGNMRHLRVLYEERQRAERREKEELASQLEEVKTYLEQQNKKNCELQERISILEIDVSRKYDDIKQLESNLGLTKAENRQYQEELAVINQLFSETLLRYNTTQELDLDKLQKHLEDHHGLLKDIVVNEVCSDVSYALPKVLLELINQLQASEDAKEDAVEQIVAAEDELLDPATTTTRHQMSSAEEIVENLPKVWKVLIELLSHQVVPTNVLTDDDKNNENPCYKKIETAKGSSLVLSVSQTYIRLKDLILEKKSLEKETAHLKHLNCHLENRLQDQEKRLELVQSELSKTWLVVGKLQKQHQMLHTQEKILRYELAQKRKLLNELKEELEDSREKWAQAREKNITTEEQWKQLRTEFANRKNAATNDDLNNSAESGYSDDIEGSSDDEPGYETDVSESEKRTSAEVLEQNPKEIIDETHICEVNHSNNEENDITETNDVLDLTESAKLSIISPKSSSEKDKITEESVEKQFSRELEAGTSKVLEKSNIAVDEAPIHILKPELSVSKENVFSATTLEYLQTQEEKTDSPEEPCTSKSSEIHHTLRESKQTTNPKSSQLEEQISSSKGPTCLQTQEKNSIPEEPGTSTSSESKSTLEEILARREERLKRLEDQATNLVTKAANTANRSVEIANKLENLHEIYKESNESNEDKEAEEASVESSDTEK